MRCDLAAAGGALPTLPVPVLLSPDPLRLARFYVHVLEFELVQHIVGVFASLRGGALPLQIWGRQDAKPGCTRILLETGDTSIFEVHRQLVRTAPALLDASSPQLMPWGARQLRMTDIDGNQLLFIQWPECARVADTDGQGTSPHSRGDR
jgi:hypothetical protein